MIWIWQAIRLLFIPAIPKVNNLRTRENEDFDVIDPAEVGNDGGVTESGDNITDSLKVIIFIVFNFEMARKFKIFWEKATKIWTIWRIKVLNKSEKWVDVVYGWPLTKERSL